MTRKIQSEDLSLEVVHPDAACIDIGNESHYVAVPPTRDPNPYVARMYYVGAEGDGGLAEAARDSDHSSAIDWSALDRGLRHSRRSWFRRISGECQGCSPENLCQDGL
jgi:hypothetical protein